MQHFKHWLLSRGKDIARKATASLFALLFLVPLLTSAQAQAPAPYSPPITDHHLVPCGFVGHPCTFADVIGLVNLLVNFLLFQVAIPLALVSIVSAGIYMMVYSDSPGKIATAKGWLWDIVVGFMLAFGAWAIVNFILGFLSPEAAKYINGGK